MSHAERPRRSPWPIALAVAGALVLAGGAVGANLLDAGFDPAIQFERPMSRVAFDAYTDAATAAEAIAPGCRVDWAVLAGLGRVESKHGRIDDRRRILPNGDVEPPIRGPRLDGTRGTQPIPDTDAGAFDGDATWDRAMGPLQFIPTTWSELGRDGNEDGIVDPDNLYDAAHTAVALLCRRAPGDYTDRDALRRALITYNPSGSYADEVLRWVGRYREAEVSELVEPS